MTIKKPVIPAVILACVGLALSIYQLIPDPDLKTANPADIPVVMRHREGCFVCHQDVTGFAASHDPKVLGCSTCHQGDPLSSDKDKAHEGMIRIPGSMDTVEQSCGQSNCHRDLVAKVSASLMATGQGMVSVNRYVFGQTFSPDGPGHLSHLGDSAADTHLRQLCVTCHLGFPKKEYAAIDQTSRGGGCTACHINYTGETENQLQNYLETRELPTKHPSLDIRIDNNRCFGCHSRSARISLNYEGWAETELKPKQLSEGHKYRILQDKRVLEHKGADIHYEKGMVCIDCHTARDAMGDGTVYNHQEEQVEISCDDCHTADKGTYVSYTELDADSRKIVDLKGRSDRDRLKYRLTKLTGKPFTNIYLDQDGNQVFQGKLDENTREMKPPAASCTEIEGHDRLTCQSCHTAWAPTCINCHTQFEAQKSRKDHYTGEPILGVWKEYKSELLAIPPALGVRLDKKRKKEVVDTFIPGMILTIGGLRDNKPDRSSSLTRKNRRVDLFQRMFSPTFSHTITSNTRSCESCHQDPWSVGLGQGKIVYSAEDPSKKRSGVFFRSHQKLHPEDGLPRDAWTGFMINRTRRVSTRTGARPFNRDEQWQILRVGRCLKCHEPDEKNMNAVYLNFVEADKNRPQVCNSDDFLID